MGPRCAGSFGSRSARSAKKASKSSLPASAASSASSAASVCALRRRSARARRCPGTRAPRCRGLLPDQHHVERSRRPRPRRRRTASSHSTTCMGMPMHMAQPSARWRSASRRGSPMRQASVRRRALRSRRRRAPSDRALSGGTGSSAARAPGVAPAREFGGGQLDRLGAAGAHGLGQAAAEIVELDRLHADRDDRSGEAPCSARAPGRR